MITHLVFWKMKDQADGRTGKENAEVMVQRLNALNGLGTPAISIEAGVNFNTSPAAYDVGLHTKFKTKQDLEAYQKHPAHVHVAEWISTVVDARAVADFEI